MSLHTILHASAESCLRSESQSSGNAAQWLGVARPRRHLPGNCSIHDCLLAIASKLERAPARRGQMAVRVRPMRISDWRLWMAVAWARIQEGLLDVFYVAHGFLVAHFFLPGHPVLYPVSAAGSPVVVLLAHLVCIQPLSHGQELIYSNLIPQSLCTFGTAYIACYVYTNDSTAHAKGDISRPEYIIEQGLDCGYATNRCFSEESFVQNPIHKSAQELRSQSHISPHVPSRLYELMTHISPL